MQVKKLVLALAVAFVAPSAFAADLSTGVTVDNIMYVTGATAQTKGIAISVGRLCGTNPLITLTDGAAVPVGRGWKCNAPAGTAYANLPGVTGPFVVLKNEGGSLNAITPMRNGTTQSQLNLTNCTLTTATTGTCTIDPVGKPAHIGFADVSSKIFAAKGQLVAQTAGNTYVADIAVGAGQGFGVVVSPALYTLLQADQGVTTPSISKAQYASLMTQTAGFWSILLPNGTAHAALPLTLDRRSLTSGTQASAEVFFLGNPCAQGAVGGSATATLGSSTGVSYLDGANTLIVKQASSSDAVLLDASSTTAYVIGVVSLENAQPASSWKFLAIDGVHPGTANTPQFQKTNIVNGTYAYAFETFMFKNTKSTLGTAVLNNINDFSNAFVADLGVGANLATSNGLFGDPAAPAADYGLDTNHYSRGGNECATPGWFF
jgi:hypothetical protein